MEQHEKTGSGDRSSVPDRLSSSDPVEARSVLGKEHGPLRLAIGVCSAALVLIAIGWLTLIRTEHAGLLIVLVVAFFLGVIGTIAFSGPFVMRFQDARSVTAGVASAVAATGLLLALLQVLPKDTGTASSPQRAAASASVEGGNEEESSPQAEAEQAEEYELCIQQARGRAEMWPPPPQKGVRGRVMSKDFQGTTVVISDGDSTWACNFDPDFAVSYPGSAVIDVGGPSDFALASYFGPPPIYWGGGALPHGATAVTFIFPDGHEVLAETDSGYWVMHYSPRRDFPSTGAQIQVRVRTHNDASGSTFELTWGKHTCNQVSHGC